MQRQSCIRSTETVEIGDIENSQLSVGASLSQHQIFDPNPGVDCERQKIRLATMFLRSAGRVRIRAFGTSMLPTIWPGDVLLVEGTSLDRLACGDVALVSREDGIRIHRLVNKNGTHWSTRGDAMPQNDPPLQAAEIVGRVLEVHAGNRVLTLPKKVQPLTRLLAWVLCHSQLCRRIAFLAHSACRARDLHVSLQSSFGRKDSSTAS